MRCFHQPSQLVKHSMADVLVHPQIGRLIAQHLDPSSIVMLCDSSRCCRDLYLPFLGPLAQVQMQHLYTSCRLVLQKIVREALVKSHMSPDSSRHSYLYFTTGVLCDKRTMCHHFLCAALAVLTDKAKRIPEHLVEGCVTPLDVDFGPYDIPADSESIYDYALVGYGYIGRKAGDMFIAGKTLSISEEYSKMCPSSLIRPLSINITLLGSVSIKTNSRPGAYHRDNVTVKQQWPPFTLWSESDLKGFAHSEDIEQGFTYHDWGMFLTMQTGDFPSKPPFYPKNWENVDRYEPGPGRSCTTFTAFQTDNSKETSCFKYCEEVNRSLWVSLDHK